MFAKMKGIENCQIFLPHSVRTKIMIKILKADILYDTTVLQDTVGSTSKVKLKESRNRPGMAQSVQGGLGSQIFMTFGT
jgi:hypothetical protein